MVGQKIGLNLFNKTSATPDIPVLSTDVKCVLGMKNPDFDFPKDQFCQNS
jgi:hypothetical protein